MGFGPKMTLQRQMFIPSFYVLCYFHNCIGSQTLKFDYIKGLGKGAKHHYDLSIRDSLGKISSWINFMRL